MGQPKHTLIQQGMPSGFLSKLELYCLTREDAKKEVGNDDVAYFQLLKTFSYQSQLLGGIVEVAGTHPPFITDLGSIPRMLWWFLSPDDYDISYPSVIHDYLYDRKGDLSAQAGLSQKRIDRKTADMVLREAMASVEASAFKQFVVYWAVRLFGPRW